MLYRFRLGIGNQVSHMIRLTNVHKLKQIHPDQRPARTDASTSQNENPFGSLDEVYGVVHCVIFGKSFTRLQSKMVLARS